MGPLNIVNRCLQEEANLALSFHNICLFVDDNKTVFGWDTQLMDWRVSGHGGEAPMLIPTPNSNNQIESNHIESN